MYICLGVFCPCDFTKYQGKCYWASSWNETFNKSRAHCQTTFGGDLVSIKSKEENDFVNQLLDRLACQVLHKYCTKFHYQFNFPIFTDPEDVIICMTTQKPYCKLFELSPVAESDGHLQSCIQRLAVVSVEFANQGCQPVHHLLKHCRFTPDKVLEAGRSSILSSTIRCSNCTNACRLSNHGRHHHRRCHLNLR